MSGPSSASAHQLAELARLGSATVYEAGGRGGYVDADLHQAVPGSRAAGPARTVACGQDDNLMVHAVMAEVRPGEVLVLTMPEPRPVALVGDLLATQAQVAGAAAILVDAAIRDVEELAEMELPIWARWVRVKGSLKQTTGEINVPVTVGGATINPGDVLVLDADGVAVLPEDRVGEVLEASLAREQKERIKREQLRAGAKSYDLDGLRAVVEEQQKMSELTPPDIAHLGPLEIFTPKPQESLEFFTEMMGMGVEHQERQSVYLRGWDDYQRWSLKLTEAEQSGLGYCGFRTWSQEALERRVGLIEATGLGMGWEDNGDLGVGRAYSFQDPDGHSFKIYNEVERYVKPAEEVTDFKNVHGKQPNKAIAVKRLDHLNILAGDVRSQRDFCVDTLGYRLYERIELDDGSEAGAWMSVSIAAHELIYTKDAYAAQGAHGRLHHVAFWVDTREECLRAADIWIENDVYIEFAPSKHNVAQGFFLYGYEPGGNRIEITSGGRLVYAPDEPCVVWTEADRAKGQAWHNETVHTFHTYGTPPVEST